MKRAIERVIASMFLQRKADMIRIVIYVILFLVLAALFIAALWYKLPRFAS